MGGFGSGNWYRWDKKDTTEDCRHIDINRWFREKLLRPGYSFNWYWKNVQENEKASITVKAIQDAVELSYTITIPNSEPVSIKYKIPLSWTLCNYGGVRPWFKCPGIINGHHCWKRAAKLYFEGQIFPLQELP